MKTLDINVNVKIPNGDYCGSNLEDCKFKICSYGVTQCILFNETLNADNEKHFKNYFKCLTCIRKGIESLDDYDCCEE